MLLIRVVLAGALLFVGAASSDQAAPTLTVSCKVAALEALWSGTDSFTCTVKPVQQSPSADLKMSCLAPAGMTCEVDPPTVRLSAPPQAGYIDVAVRLSYTPALAAGESPLEIRAGTGDLPASTTIPVVKNLNTLSSACPTAADLQTIDRDLRLVWRSDPTAGTVACRKADGSRDLTVMQARVYRALNTMRHLSFTEPLPWTRDPVYRWFTRAVRGLEFRSDVAASNCCSADKLINIRAVVSPGPSGGQQQGFTLAITAASQMPTDFRMLASFLQLLVHEARHADGKRHTCGPSDQTMEEMGAWAAAHAFQTWIADKMAPGLVPQEVRANLRQQADLICRTRICGGCKTSQYPQDLSHLRHNSPMQLTVGTVVLAHGAGAGKDHPWMQRVVGAFASHGIKSLTFNFPYMDAGRSAPDRAPVLESHYASIWKDLTHDATPPFYAAGKSMGGRIASQVAAQKGFEPAPAGLIFFGYPLHPPNQPNKRRDEHLPKIAAPMLFLHGTRDPFGTPDEMQTLTAGLPGATLHLIDGGDHSLVVKRKDGADSVERAVAVAAGWITRRPATAPV